jgi:hypothetical protein
MLSATMYVLDAINYNACFRCLILEIIEVRLPYTSICNYLLKVINLCDIFFYNNKSFFLKKSLNNAGYSRWGDLPVLVSITVTFDICLANTKKSCIEPTFIIRMSLLLHLSSYKCNSRFVHKDL